MLRTNSKQAAANIRAYIMNNVDFDGYELEQEPKTWHNVACAVMEIFREEKKYELARYRGMFRGVSEQDIFSDWTRGLPSVLNCCYWYNRPAVDDLGAILEETEEERNRYDEEEAGVLLTWLMYQELKKEVNK